VTKARCAPRQRKEAPRGVLTKPHSVRFVTVMAFVLPGSGQVFNGAPYRGVIMQAGMVFGAFITYMLTTPEISPLGRMAGGLLVYVFSVVDANGIAKLRVKSWERMHAGGQTLPPEEAVAGNAARGSGGAHQKGHVDAVPRGRARKRPADSARHAEEQAARSAESGRAREPENGTSSKRSSTEQSSG